MSARAALRAATTIGWTTAALVTARLGALVTLEVKLRGRAPDIVLWDISHQADVVTLHALTAAVLIWALARLGSRSRAAAAVCALLAVVAAVSALSGWPIGQVHQVPGLDSDRNRLGWGLFLIAGAALTWLTRKLVREELPSERQSLHATLAVAAAVLPPLAFYQTMGTISSERTVTEIHREFAFESEQWKVTRLNPYERPHLGNLTPSFDYRVDGGDRPAILMPPPCELSVVIREEDAGTQLQTAVGIGRDLFNAHPKPSPAWPKRTSSVRIRFEVELDGVSVFDEVLSYDKDPETQGERIWRYLGHDEELSVEPGQELTFRTSWVEPIFQTDIRTPVAVCGFGSPQLVKQRDLPRADSSPETPNIVLIVMDTLRADRLSSYGHHRETTPNIDALAARGLIYEEARSTSSWTWPSTASILTGLHPQTHGVVSDGSCYLDARLRSLPEALEERGYTTVAFTCNPLIVPNKNFHQGFETFDSYHTFRKSDSVLDTIKNFMERHAGTRFFLYLHLVDPHEQYELSQTARDRVQLPDQAPKGMPDRPFRQFRGALLNGRGHDHLGNSNVDEYMPAEFAEWMHHSYDAAVATADEYVGELLAQLSNLGLTEETIIVFTSDHGEELLEHGHLAHGQSLHEELVRVPLIFAGPGIPEGVRTTKLVSNRHIAPTLAKFGGVELPAIPDPRDLSAPDALREGSVITSTEQGWWNGRHRLPIYGITNEEWTLHWAPDGSPWAEEPEPDTPGMWRLFNRANDPHEHTDLAQEEPEIAAALLEELKETLREASARSTGTQIGVGAAGADLLQGIGYIDGGETED
ncbi:MAG: sulfatase [Planctomycetes bacterium]|nr:sulfatase [Planctomycetota bacterium]